MSNFITIDERLIRLENRIVNENKFVDTMENINYDFDLPADTVTQLQRIDCQLQDKCIAAEMVCIQNIHFIIFD